MQESLFLTLKNEPLFFLIAGPCVIESKAVMFETAEYLKNLTTWLHIPFVYKSSFNKANRTSSESYSGPGIDDGLKLLQQVKSEYEVPILTDIHETTDVALVSEVADIIQIPAFLSRQTALLQAAALSGKVVNIKKGQFMAPEDMQAAALKVTSAGNEQILITERGTSFGYHNLVVDFRGFSIMHSFGYPVIYDVTHSLQKPSQGLTTGGTPEFAGMMARSALATGCVSGLFIETHPEPQKALSDAASMLQLDKLPTILHNCLEVVQAMRKA